MKKFLSGVLCLVLSSVAYGQNLTQTIRGSIEDADSKSPLIGANVVILDVDHSAGIKGTITDVNGNFRITDVPVGRVTLQLSYIGYEPKTIPNIVINSAKEVVMKLSMVESAIKMDEVVVSANRTKGEPINEMAMISAQSISAEETNRYAGGFNDPSRIMANFAGVTSTQDGSNDIIVRGNSPKYVQWRLEGVQITNPNHFADQSSVGGSISTLNNNLLGTSDFYTSAFAPEYGDALSAVYDIKLRNGNNEQHEAVVGVGLLGTDLTLEGPFKKGYGGSFLANYRYSTAGLVNDLGLIDVVGIPKFQDAAFKLMLPTKKLGMFSVFGLSGLSSLYLPDVKPDLWVTPGDRPTGGELSEDYDKNAYLLNTGINHTLSLTKNSFLTTTLAYSIDGVTDEVFETRTVKIYNEQNEFQRDSIASRGVNFDSDLKKTTYRGALTYHNKINARNKIQVGTKYARFAYQFNQSQFTDTPDNRSTLVDMDEQITTIRNFISWKHRINDDITLVGGVHNMNVLFNNKHTLEPRLAMNWALTNTSSVHAGYGLHSTMETVHNYFAKVNLPGGGTTEPNHDLDLLKAHHFVVGYQKQLGRNLIAKAEVYYQHLYNLPVENSDTSFYATINEGLDPRYVDLVNEGTGKNYGLELTLERYFDHHYYFLVNGSLYNSKYTALDGIERNTAYNGRYLVNVLMGKEFVNMGRKNNQTLGLNAKIFFGGGKKIIPLLRDEKGNLAVDPENNKYWDYNKAYDNDIEDVYQVIVSASYKWNKPKATHELFLNLDNVTNTKGKITEYYDEDEPDKVGNMTQFGFFPNLMYRVYF